MYEKPLEDQRNRSAKGIKKKKGRKITITELFGLVVEVQMSRKGLSKAYVARQCYISEEVLGELIRGEIDENLLQQDDDLVHDLADTLEIPVKAMEILLGNIAIEEDYDVIEEVKKILDDSTKTKKKPDHWFFQWFRNKQIPEKLATS